MTAKRICVDLQNALLLGWSIVPPLVGDSDDLVQCGPRVNEHASEDARTLVMQALHELGTDAKV